MADTPPLAERGPQQPQPAQAEAQQQQQQPAPQQQRQKRRKQRPAQLSLNPAPHTPTAPTAGQNHARMASKTPSTSSLQSAPGTTTTTTTPPPCSATSALSEEFGFGCLSPTPMASPCTSPVPQQQQQQQRRGPGDDGDPGHPHAPWATASTRADSNPTPPRVAAMVAAKHSKVHRSASSNASLGGAPASPTTAARRAAAHNSSSSSGGGGGGGNNNNSHPRVARLKGSPVGRQASLPAVLKPVSTSSLAARRGKRTPLSALKLPVEVSNDEDLRDDTMTDDQLDALFEFGAASETSSVVPPSPTFSAYTMASFDGQTSASGSVRSRDTSRDRLAQVPMPRGADTVGPLPALGFRPLSMRPQSLYLPPQDALSPAQQQGNQRHSSSDMSLPPLSKEPSPVTSPAPSPFPARFSPGDVVAGSATASASTSPQRQRQPHSRKASKRSLAADSGLGTASSSKSHFRLPLREDEESLNPSRLQGRRLAPHAAKPPTSAAPAQPAPSLAAVAAAAGKAPASSARRSIAPAERARKQLSMPLPRRRSGTPPNLDHEHIARWAVSVPRPAHTLQPNQSLEDMCQGSMMMGGSSTSLSLSPQGSPASRRSVRKTVRAFINRVRHSVRRTKEESEKAKSGSLDASSSGSGGSGSAGGAGAAGGGLIKPGAAALRRHSGPGLDRERRHSFRATVFTDNLNNGAFNSVSSTASSAAPALASAATEPTLQVPAPLAAPRRHSLN